MKQYNDSLECFYIDAVRLTCQHCGDVTVLTDNDIDVTNDLDDMVYEVDWVVENGRAYCDQECAELGRNEENN